MREKISIDFSGQCQMGRKKQTEEEALVMTPLCQLPENFSTCTSRIIPYRTASVISANQSFKIPTRIWNERRNTAFAGRNFASYIPFHMNRRIPYVTVKSIDFVVFQLGQRIGEEGTHSGVVDAVRAGHIIHDSLRQLSRPFELGRQLFKQFRHVRSISSRTQDRVTVMNAKNINPEQAKEFLDSGGDVIG